MTPCETCRGNGSYERNVPGFEGVPERDDEVICSDCGGLGYIEAFDMLTCIIAIRDSDRLARSLGQPGIGGMYRRLIANVVAKVTDYSTERLAEIRAKEVYTAEEIAEVETARRQEIQDWEADRAKGLGR